MPAKPTLVRWIQVVSRRGTSMAYAEFTLPKAPGWIIRIEVEDDGEVGVRSLRIDPDPDAPRQHLHAEVVRALPLNRLAKIVRDEMRAVGTGDTSRAGLPDRLKDMVPPAWWHEPKQTTFGDPWSHQIATDTRTKNNGETELQLARLAERYVELAGTPSPRQVLAKETGYSKGGLAHLLTRCREVGLLYGSARAGGHPLDLTDKARLILGRPVSTD